jgi:uncharacterized Fe-S cluster protein YjdI
MHEYKGDKITIFYDEHTCIHAGECVKNLPSVFNVNNKPWIDANGANLEETKRVIGMCPSRALTYKEVVR